MRNDMLARRFMNPTKDIVVISDRRELAAIRNEWLTLETAGGCPSPFQSWRWVSAWLDDFSDEHVRPLVLLARDEDGAARAILPLQRDRHMGFSRITWLSAPALQYGGLLAKPLPAAEREKVFAALWERLLAEPADYVDLPLLRGDDPFAGFLAARGRRGPENAAWVIDMSEHADWRAYELSLKSSARRSRKKRLNKFRRAGEVTFVVHEGGEWARAALRAALEWKREWLTVQGLAGALPFHAAFGALLEDAFAAPAKGGAGRWLVAELRLNGAPVAVDAGIALNGVYHAWFSAYDAAFASHSPGKIALWLMLQWCMEHELKVYDMLANPAPYKEDWATGRRPLAHFLKARSTAGRAYVLWATQGAALAREVYQALPPSWKALVRKPLLRLRGGMGKAATNNEGRE